MTSRSRRALAAEAALIGVAAVWGLTFVMVKDAVEEIPVLAFLAYRFLPAAVLVSAVFWGQLRRLTAEAARTGIFMGILLTAGYIFQTFGLERTTASNAGFITGMFVVLTPLFGIAFGERPGRAGWAAAAVSAVGLWLLSGGARGGSRLGDALVFLCACSFAGHILATDHGVKKHDVGALLAVQLWVCGLTTLIATAAMGELPLPRRETVWTALAVTALGATALAFFIQSYAQKNTAPARTALILASEPAFAGLFAYILVGERLTATGWAGAGLIMAAIIVAAALPYVRPIRPQLEG
ncbi:MAG TPA: DMT family transporter [Actinomycetota bacterium]|nr:DMT family transporter [Actinomycetota bacterium]